MKQELENVVCAGCSLLCDDIRLTIEDDRLVDSANSCELGKDWIAQLSTAHSFAVNGKSVAFDGATAEAAALLQQSKSPLICGLDGLSTRSQVTAVKLAKQIGATIDTTFTNRQRHGMLAMQTTGKVTATLGEVASRADVISFWYCDPLTTHPRFVERFCSSAKQLIVIDETMTETAKRATRFFQIGRQELYDLLAQLRLSIRNLDNPEPGETARNLGSSLRNSQYGALVYGSMDFFPNQKQILQSLYQLTREMNQKCRTVAVGLRADANTLSAENVLSWNSGYPFAVSFNSGVAQYCGLEFSAQTMLARRECDVALICSTKSLSQLSEPAVSHLHQIPKIVINSQSDSLGYNPTVQFGVNFDAGDWCRLDDVALPVANTITRPAHQSLSAGDVLTAILVRVCR